MNTLARVTSAARIEVAGGVDTHQDTHTAGVEDRRHAAEIASQDRRNAAHVALRDRRGAADLAAIDRRDAYDREWRERTVLICMRRIEDAIALLDAWEQAWRLGSVHTLIGATNGAVRDGWLPASAHLGALLRASARIYPRGMAAYLGIDAVEQSNEIKDLDRSDLLKGGELARGLVRGEILRIIDSSRLEMLRAPLDLPGRPVPVSPASEGTSETLEGSARAPGPETSAEVLEGPGTPEVPEAPIPPEKEKTEG
jgi:hypothetical protein